MSNQTYNSQTLLPLHNPGHTTNCASIFVPQGTQILRPPIDWGLIAEPKIDLNVYRNRHGKKMQGFVDETEINTRANIELIFWQTIAAMSLAVHGLVDVDIPYNDGSCIKPTTTNILTLIGAAQKKSTIKDIAHKPFYEFEQKQREIYNREMRIYDIRYKAWKRENNKLKNQLEASLLNNLPTDDEIAALDEHEELKPKKPVIFRMLFEDSTMEALCGALNEGLNSVCAISAEGLILIKGRLSQDLPKLNAFWSGETVIIDRVGRGNFYLASKRVQQNILLQTEPFFEHEKKKGKQTRTIGAWARFLPIKPTISNDYTTSGTVVKTEKTEKFYNAIYEFLELQASMLKSGIQERRVVKFGNQAKIHFRRAVTQIQEMTRPGGGLENVPDFGSRLAEHIARVAAVMHTFEGHEGDIDINTLSDAIDICNQSVKHFIHIFATTPELKAAQQLDDWIGRNLWQLNRYTPKNGLRQYGPYALRETKDFDAALRVLVYQANRVRILKHKKDKTLYIDLHPSLTPDLFEIMNLEPVTGW